MKRKSFVGILMVIAAALVLSACGQMEWQRWMPEERAGQAVISGNVRFTDGYVQSAAVCLLVDEGLRRSFVLDGASGSFEGSEEGIVLNHSALVSMNFWGFTPWFFDKAEAALLAFLQGPGDPLKKEYPLPQLVDALMHEAGLKVDVLSTRAVWFGVTNPEDKAVVQAELRKLHASGAYPAAL